MWYSSELLSCTKPFTYVSGHPYTSFWIVVLEEALESPLDCKENKPIHFEGNQPWMLTGRTDPEAWGSNTLAISQEEKTPWKSPWYWESVKEREEGDDRGWDGWTGSSKRPRWIWPNSRRQWKTGGPDVLWSTGSCRVGHDLMTKQQQSSQQMNTNIFAHADYIQIFALSFVMDCFFNAQVTVIVHNPCQWI